MKVFFDEEAQIEALYTDLSFYSAIGEEFCLVFDIFYAKSGTEAVAESCYRVVEKQEMEGSRQQALEKADPSLDKPAKEALLTHQFIKGLPNEMKIKLLQDDPTPNLDGIPAFVRRYRAV